MKLRTGGTALIAVILVQFTVPFIVLLDVPPTRFGFQMYSAQGQIEVQATDAQGREVAVDVEDVVGELRGELDWTGVLPETVCDHLPLVAEVTVVQSEHRRTVQCSE
jgi:hypothetical protein